MRVLLTLPAGRWVLGQGCYHRESLQEPYTIAKRPAGEGGASNADMCLQDTLRMLGHILNHKEDAVNVISVSPS